jgi:hypothetical protein
VVKLTETKESCDTVRIISPLGFTVDSEFSHGQIYVVAGMTNMGKTIWALNMAKDNATQFQVYYINVESSPQEMARAVRRFPDIDLQWWDDHVTLLYTDEQGQQLGDLIIPGEGVLNIIDYVNAPGGDYSQVDGAINAIWERLDGAMAVVVLQQWTADHNAPAGGRGVLQRPRLVISLLREQGRQGRRFVRVLKDKVTPGRNDGDELFFNLHWQENRFESLHPGHEPDCNPDQATLTFEGTTYERS